MSAAPKFLFVPVSSDEGIGEYMRSKIIADEVMRRWPDAQIDFVLNRYAPYIHQCPYRTHLVDDTPTKKVKEVNQLVTDLQPDIVIFDAAGRKAQLKHAKRCGAKVIFISQHRRKRSRGMKIERALVTDSHWVVQPEFVIGDISAVDKLKLDLINRPYPKFTGSIFSQPDESQLQALLKQYQLSHGGYLLYSAGSGGHKLKAGLAADLWAEVATNVYAKTGISSVMVYGPNYPHAIPELPGVIAVSAFTSSEFINLLSAARAAILSGGDTLLQAIALNTPSLVVAVSKDQPSRIAQCYKAGLIATCSDNVHAMEEATLILLQEESQQFLKSNNAQLSRGNGLTIAMQDIEQLLTLS
ncbi:glycosyltransferase family 9 protein [Shewanella waksmanii]|uniref:glycosyltransferase family 9 protein n=1 Tax=Shewanella waksmanii TaxID=213783 RepID=UPI003736AE28